MVGNIYDAGAIKLLVIGLHQGYALAQVVGTTMPDPVQKVTTILIGEREQWYVRDHSFIMHKFLALEPLAIVDQVDEQAMLSHRTDEGTIRAALPAIHEFVIQQFGFSPAMSQQLLNQAYINYMTN